MKRRILTISLIVASLVLLVSVGFAAWVITKDQVTETKGNVEAYNVSGNSAISISVPENSKIVFGKPSPVPSITSPWLTFDAQEMGNESLSVAITVSYDRAGTITIANDLKIGETSYKTNLVGLLIGEPTFTKTSGDGTVTSAGVITFPDGGGTIVINATYTWGSLLADGTNKNPYSYFNDKPKASAANLTQTLTKKDSSTVSIIAADSWAVVAEKALGTLFDYTSGTGNDALKFVFTVSGQQ